VVVIVIKCKVLTFSASWKQ